MPVFFSYIAFPFCCKEVQQGAVSDAGWSSLVARRAHNPKVVGSNPAPATNLHCLNFLVLDFYRLNYLGYYVFVLI